MKTLFILLFVSLALIFPISQVHAKESTELRKQRQAAQQERQAEKTDRNRESAEARKSFGEFTRSLKPEYKALLKEVDIEFELTQVDLQADRAAKIAEAEAEYQKKLTSAFLHPDGAMNTDALKKMEQEAKAHSDELFRLKEEAAQIAHTEKAASEKHKHVLLQEMDTRAIDEVVSLGLTKKSEPIVATPIGGELTRQEKQWNEREKKDIERTHVRNLRTIREFKNGEKIRAWELNNLDEDFHLKWEEKRELHTIQSQQIFYSTLLMQAAQGKDINQQEVIAKFAELAKHTKLVKIKFDTIRKKESIIRRGEKKKLQES